HPLARVASCRTRLSSGTTVWVTPPCHASVACTPPPSLWSSLVSAPPPALACPALPSLRRGVAARHSSLLLVSPDEYSPTVSPHGLCLHLRERFRQDHPVLRLHSDRGGEFSSNLLQNFCRGEGILQSFTLLASPQSNGIAERCIGLGMEFARTSMINAAAPHFLWPFAVRYAAHQLNLWPRVSLPEASPTLRWTGKAGDALVFRVKGSRAFARDTSTDKLSTRAISCIFLGFPPDAPGFPNLAPSPLVDPLPFKGPAPSGVSQVNPGIVLVEVAGNSSAARGVASVGAASGCAEPGGAEPGGPETEGAGSGGAEPAAVEPRGAEPEGVEPVGSESEGAESEGSYGLHTRLWSGAAEAGVSAAGDNGAGGVGGTRFGGAGVTAGAGGTGGAAAASPGGARTRGTGAAGSGSVGGAGAGGWGAGDPLESGGARAGGTGAGGAGAGGAGAVDPRAGGAGAGGAVSGGTGAGGTVRPRPYFLPLLQQVLGLPSSPILTPPFLCPPPDQSQPPLQPASPLPAPSPYTEQTGGLAERLEPESRLTSPVRDVRTARRVPRPYPPPVPGTHAMALRPSSVPLRVPLPAPPDSSLPAVPDPKSDLAHAASPTVSRLLTTVVTDPESTAASAPVTELADFAATCRLDYAIDLVAESASATPPSVRGECALGTDVLQDRQEDFECLATAVPRFSSMLLAFEGDPDAPDIPTPRSYAEAITSPYSSQWQTAMDAEMAS
ncbi:unnamed protein product, partial [Closterium sp. NIES-54]